MRLFRPALLAACMLLAGCERLGIPDPEKVAAGKEAEGKAIGSACRHAGRAIEDCYALNPKAVKSAVFTGWKDMNDYMRENKIDNVTPLIAASRPPGKKPAGEGEAGAEAEAKPEAKPAAEEEHQAKADTKAPRKGGHG